MALRSSALTFSIDPAKFVTGQVRRAGVEGLSGTLLYRFYDAAGHLLYVGVTGRVAERWTRHSNRSEWWPQVARVTVARIRTPWDALDAERAAIKAERPLHNKRSAVR